MLSGKIVISNPYISGNHLTKIFNQNGIVMHALVAADNPFEDGNAIPDSVNVIYYDRNDLSTTINTLREIRPDFIFYGYEFDISVVDYLSGIICANCSNPPMSAGAREDKSRMYEHLSERGFRTPQKLVYDHRHSNIRFPMLSKPSTLTGGLTGVKIFDSKVCIDQFLEDHRLDSIEVEELLWDGNYLDTQVTYSVDGFAIGGEYHFVSLQRWHKVLEGETLYYYYAEQLPSDSVLSQSLFSQAEQQLKALGMRNGFFHPEFILVDDCPIMLDLNPRIAGANGIVDQMIEVSTGVGVVQEFVDIAYNKESRQHLTPHQFSRLLFLYKTEIFILDDFMKLPSYRAQADFSTLRCRIILLSNGDENQLIQDFNQAKEMAGWTKFIRNSEV